MPKKGWKYIGYFTGRRLPCYLKAFLGTHPDYDWSIFFPPSTVKYMERFKVDNAEAISTEKVKHASKVQADMDKIAADDSAKAEANAGEKALDGGEMTTTRVDVEPSPNEIIDVS